MQNNFEHLKDFSIEPNQQVWKDIEKELHPKEKRRIVGWWWTAPAGALLLLGYLFFTKDKSTIISKNNQNQTSKISDNKNDIKENITKTQADLAQTNNSLQTQVSENNNRQSVSNSQKITFIKSKNSHSDIKNPSNDTKNNSNSIKDSYSDIKNHSNDTKNNSNSIKNSYSDIRNLSNDIKNNSNSIKNSYSDIKNHSNDTKNNSNNIKNSYSDIKNLSNDTKNNSSNQENLTTANNITNSSKETNKIIEKVKPDEELKSTAVEKAIVKAPVQNKKIQFNFSLGGGSNYVSFNPILGKNQQLNYASTSTIGGSTSIPTASNPPSSLYLPETGSHFSVGITASYPLTNNIKLETGLRYRYLQNSITLNPSTVNTFSSGNTSTYINYSNQIEIPLNASLCINPKNKTKIWLTGGINMAWIFKDNWLGLDAANGKYTEPTEQNKRVLAGLQTGASIQFSNHYSLDILARKYLTPGQQSATNYYWQQIDFQLNIPLGKKR